MMNYYQIQLYLYCLENNIQFKSYCSLPQKSKASFGVKDNLPYINLNLRFRHEEDGAIFGFNRKRYMFNHNQPITERVSLTNEEIFQWAFAVGAYEAWKK